MKPIIDEFESKLKEFKAKGEEGQDIEAKAISAVKKGGRRGGRKAGSALAGLKVKGVPSGSSAQKKVRVFISILYRDSIVMCRFKKTNFLYVCFAD